MLILFVFSFYSLQITELRIFAYSSHDSLYSCLFFLFSACSMLPLGRYFRKAAFSFGLQGLQTQGYDRSATKSQSQFRAMKPCLSWREIHSPRDMSKSQFRKLAQLVDAVDPQNQRDRPQDLFFFMNLTCEPSPRRSLPRWTRMSVDFRSPRARRRARVKTRARAKERTAEGRRPQSRPDRSRTPGPPGT